ncbi:TonB-dependent receptor [Halioxenophilus sp. WMMB6]|uniref:TonB-dependent receptor n=1 Tax=Halioxenophilus sp. WMMB6 TaxID=3073815 RepID=UPI00295E89EF|nr:TonB-dependent receptor [Halioxenophilus sp. WMMB6]
MPRILQSRNLLTIAIASTTLGVTTPTFAQSDSEHMLVLEEIIVTARRKDENLQDVPITVNAVSEQALSDLNIRKLEDLQSVVAGLTLAEDPLAPSASVRGVRFDSFASGFNPTVEFYLNDAPAVATIAMQALFDVQQIEVLRGPQGTLRGRASPSGSITITTKKPVMNEFSGFVDVTSINADGYNTKAAINIPLVEDMLAIRLAGILEENDSTEVESLTSSEEARFRNKGWRFSAGFEPTDSLSFNLFYQQLEPTRNLPVHVESASIANSSLAVSDPFIRAEDRKAISNDTNYSEQDLRRTGLEASWQFSDFSLNYAGSITEQIILRNDIQDPGGYFDTTYAQELQYFSQDLNAQADAESHEIRLQTTNGLFDGKVDFVVGALHQVTEPHNKLGNQTPVFFGTVASPATYILTANTPITTSSKSTEQSIFGNISYHFNDATELSVGGRYIDYETESDVVVSGNTISAINDSTTTNIVSLSLKHQFADNLLAYGSYGTSWRPGINVVGDFSFAQTEREDSFQNLDAEESDSIEFGIKSEWLDNRLRVNITVYHQEFDNYPFRSGGEGVYFVSTEVDNTSGTPQFIESVDQFNFVAAVPVTVNGVEIENFYRFSDNWDMGLLLSYSKGELDNGTIPCNDYLPADGQPDSSGAIPSVSDIRSATGGDNIAACRAKFRSDYTPLWTGTLQSEYTFNVGSMEAYVRGMATFYGPSQNDPSNAVDDVDAYNMVNLYFGLRDPSGNWEAMLYGKNIFETEETLSREANPASVGFTGVILSPFSVEGYTAISDYREVSLTPPREIGVNLQYRF